MNIQMSHRTNQIDSINKKQLYDMMYRRAVPFL